jgi:hypothetical protein
VFLGLLPAEPPDEELLVIISSTSRGLASPGLSWAGSMKGGEDEKERRGKREMMKSARLKSKRWSDTDSQSTQEVRMRIT